MQFYAVKTNTKRLKNAKYEITFDNINHIRRNGELVAIGESQLLRSLFQLKGLDASLSTVRQAVQELSKSKRQRTSNVNKIDSLLFVPEIVSVVVDKKAEYKHISKNGFLINGKKYVRLLCGAGHARRNSALFIQEEFEKPLKELLNNDRNPEVQIAPSKFNAYFALCASATYQVSEPEFAVVKDCEVTRESCEVEFVDEIAKTSNPYEDDRVYATKLDLPFNLFDGMGLISPRQAKIWADELALEYIPSTFIIRNNFMKGMLAVFDFHAFANEFDKRMFVDIWGNRVDVRNVDIVLSESQLKMWNAFASHADYVDKCRKNGLNWGISRFAPRYDSDHIFSNYQFLQVEDYSQDDIEKLCQPTVDFLSGAIGSDVDITKLYLMGKVANQYYDSDIDILGMISDPVTKAILLHGDMVKDPYVQSHIINSLNKKIRESYFGNLIVPGNYSTIIGDPYAFCEYVFGMEVNGLLGVNEHYSTYWINKNVSRVAAMRAPLTWRSEVNILNFSKNILAESWYKYLDSGIIYNIHGYDAMLQADSDLDGDLVMTTNSEQIIKNAYGGLPVTYTKNKTPKETIEEDKLFEYDLKAFDSRIGFITNCSTTLYAMLANYESDSVQSMEITKRLKICRKNQGNQIDKAKGLVVAPFPKHWTQWTRINANNSQYMGEIELNNELLIDKRPYFMRYLYRHYNHKFLQHNKNFDRYCFANFGKSYKDAIGNFPEMESVVEKYEKYSPLIDNDCTMNNICHYMEEKIRQIRVSLPASIDDKNLHIMKDANIPFDSDKYKLMEALFRKYRTERRHFNKLSSGGGSDSFSMYKTIEQYNKAICSEASLISENNGELVNLALAVCYELYPSDGKSFVWSVFGDALVENIKANVIASGQESILVPFLATDQDDVDTTTYLGRAYKNYDVAIGNVDVTDYDYLENFGE